MFGEKFSLPEAPAERVLEGEEREKFKQELEEYIVGLEAALQDPNLPEDDRTELEEQLAGLKDSLEEIERGGDIKIKK